MSFNNHTTDPLEPDLGIPQGSPLSPILSALVTGPILQLANMWKDSNLTLYINDGNIFASSPTYKATMDKLTKSASDVFSWLRQSGFTINSNKCKAMFF